MSATSNFWHDKSTIAINKNKVENILLSPFGFLSVLTALYIESSGPTNVLSAKELYDKIKTVCSALNTTTKKSIQLITTKKCDLLKELYDLTLDQLSNSKNITNYKLLCDISQMTNNQILHRRNVSHMYYENSSYQVLEMPYVGQEFDMGFILPLHGKNQVIPVDAINKLVENLHEMNIARISIPKFNIGNFYDLSKCFKQLNIQQSLASEELPDSTEAINDSDVPNQSFGLDDEINFIVGAKSFTHYIRNNFTKKFVFVGIINK